MIELPEALTLAKQLGNLLVGRKIQELELNQSPHKFAWFSGEAAEYRERLLGTKVLKAEAFGGYVELSCSRAKLAFAEGVNLRHHPAGQERAAKHQLLLSFDDGSALSAAVQMYGGLWCFGSEGFDNTYYKQAREKPAPLSAAFTLDYFRSNILGPAAGSKSLKAALATDQAIPGFGNGVLQDVLFQARLHPKRKIATLSDAESEKLYRALVTVIGNMADQGGRDTEKDLFGVPGGYRTRMSRKALDQPCPVCGSTIVKEAYLGGAVYFCPVCQT